MPNESSTPLQGSANVGKSAFISAMLSMFLPFLTTIAVSLFQPITCFVRSFCSLLH